MYSDDEKVVLCGASAYEQKYYFNQDFASLPQSVQEKKDLLESLELYYRVFFLGEEVPEEAFAEEDGEKPDGK